MRATVPGTYHTSGQFYIQYNTAAFGANIVSANTYTIERLGLMNEEVFPGFSKYPATNIFVNNNVNSGVTSLAINYSAGTLSGGAAGSFILTEVPVSFTPMLRISIDIQDGTELAGIDFSKVLMESAGGQFFYLLAGATATAAAQVQYSVPYAYANDLLTTPLGSSFPVEFLSFEAKAQSPETVALSWETASELNNDHFEVEKSFDGETFAVIGEVAGAGTTDQVQRYQFLDRGNMAPVQYYRLRQVDYDGAFAYSSTVEVRMAEQAGQVIVSPNPVMDRLQIVLVEAERDVRAITLTDMTGREVYRGLPSLQAGRASLDVSTTPAGIYLLSVQYTDGLTVTDRVRVLP